MESNFLKLDPLVSIATTKMVNKICFIGAFGAGKSHTIKELLGDYSTPDIVVSDRFGSVTRHETKVLIPSEMEDLSRSSILVVSIAKILMMLILLQLSDRMTDPVTIFVLVLNASERRLVSIDLARQVIRGRRFSFTITIVTLLLFQLLGTRTARRF
jgi:hypothetical protein